MVFSGRGWHALTDLEERFGAVEVASLRLDRLHDHPNDRRPGFLLSLNDLLGGGQTFSVLFGVLPDKLLQGILVPGEEGLGERHARDVNVVQGSERKGGRKEK